MSHSEQEFQHFSRAYWQNQKISGFFQAWNTYFQIEGLFQDSKTVMNPDLGLVIHHSTAFAKIRLSNKFAPSQVRCTCLLWGFWTDFTILVWPHCIKRFKCKGLLPYLPDINIVCHQYADAFYTARASSFVKGSLTQIVLKNNKRHHYEIDL